MNAKVSRLHVAVDPERRRANTISSIAVSLSANELTMRATVPTLGNRASYVTLRAIYEKLDHELSRIECLADEFLELAQHEEAESGQ